MTAKFWIGGTGTWDNTGDTHWSLSSGGANNTTHPVAGDTATLDGSSGGGTVTVNANLAMNSITCGAFTGTLDFSANNNSVTLSATGGFSGSGSGTRTINLGNGTWTLSATGAGTPWNMGTTTNLTFNANSSTIDFSGAATSNQTFSGGGLTYNIVKISGSRLNAVTNFNGGGTFGTFNVAAPATVNVAAAVTITTLLASPGAFLGFVGGGTTTTITNAFTLAGTQASPISLINQAGITGAAGIISIASGTATLSYGIVEGFTFSGGATFNFTNSYDIGRNSGTSVFTAPSTSGGMLFNPNLDGV